MKEMSLEEKIRLIEASNSFADIPQDAFPKSHKENYYFVSYSHKDYKRVLKDIILLEDMGINIWYDSEMHVGENWQEIAELYISKFQCAGVIFYLSENSISSPACNREVEYVLTHNKDFFSINMPLTGRGVESGYSMLCELGRRGLARDAELFESFKKAFPDEVLYLSVDDTVEKKANQILSLKREELLGLSESLLTRGVMLSSCRDNTLINIDLTKIYDNGAVSGYITEIGDCVFTNSVKLQSVKLAEKVERIGESAFRNCTELREIDLSGKKLIIDNNAFRNCISLGKIDISAAQHIGRDAFRACKNLDIDRLSGAVASNAFSETAIRKIDYIAENPFLGEGAFSKCPQLEIFNITGTFRQRLPANAFAESEKLRIAGPFIALSSYSPGCREALNVGYGCFSYCKSLESVRFAGLWDLSDAESAFLHCDSLKKLELDVASSVIPVSFAKDCENLTELAVKSPIINIGKHAFANCSSLKKIDLCNAKSIERQAFYGSGIEHLYLKDAEEISYQAFSEMPYLESVTVGAECSQMGDGAFLGCKSLKTVKILSEKLEISSYKSIFMRCPIEVFYLRNLSIYNALVSDGALETLKVLYIGDNLSGEGIIPEGFDHAESDVGGFMKFVRGELLLRGDEEQNIDLSSAELNERDNYREPFKYKRVLDLLGHEVIIKHSRLIKPRKYFVEDAVYYPGTDTIEYLVVSVHTGVSFRLDSTLIESIEPTEYQGADWFMLDKPCEIEDKSCCVISNGERHYCQVMRVEHFSVFGTALTKGSKYPLKAIYGEEDSRLIAISGLDIESIVVFNDNFEVEKVIKRESESNRS